MKKFIKATLLSCFLILSSCGTIEQISIDYLIPADVSFPPQIRRVGVVNNTGDLSDPSMIENDTANQENRIARKINYYRGNSEIAAEALAEAIAAENYFDLVVINDSLLRAGDIHLRETTLSRAEVQELTEEMGVDMIIALESLIIKSTRTIMFLPDMGMFRGTVDAKIFPGIKLYIPSRTAPLLTINALDSIFWEDFRYTENHLRSMGVISEEDLIKEASAFAGSIPVKHIIPYWSSDMRYFYGGGSVDMRDAAIFVRENSWDKAYELWKKVYESGKGKKKMRAAYNIGLYYEIKDDMDNAYTWVNNALEIARVIEKITDPSKVAGSSNYKFIAQYLMKLDIRKENMSKLIMQMDRF